MMKNKLMQRMANAIVLPTVLTISALAANAQKLDRPVDLNTGLDGYALVEILDDEVIESADADIKAIAVEQINNIDTPIIVLDYVRGGVLLDVVKHEPVVFDQVQAITGIDIVKTINR